MKPILFTSFLLGISILSSAQSAGPLSGNNFGTLELSGADVSWHQIENASGSDNAYAVFDNISNVVGAHTDYLVLTKFKFNIPADKVITGIQVVVENTDPGGATADHSIRLLKNGELTGLDRSTGKLYFNENYRDEFNSYGSTIDLWGETWTPEDINSEGFGVAISAKRAVKTVPTKGAIDDVRITVYYSTRLTTLPLRLVSFAGFAKNDRTTLNWRTIEELAMKHFEVERSANGTDFTTIGTVPCANRALPNDYSFDDRNPVNGNSWYRLKIVSVDGAITYSRIITIHNSSTASHYLFPSPWRQGSTLFIRNTTNEKLTIVFYSTSGELLGKATTSNHIVPTENIKSTSGTIHYKIYNEEKEATGSGKITAY